MGRALSVEEVAEYLGLSRDTVYRKARRGEIPGIRVGRSWRFPLDILEDWLRDRAGSETGSWKYRKRNREKVVFGTYECGGLKGALRREEIYEEGRS